MNDTTDLARQIATRHLQLVPTDNAPAAPVDDGDQGAADPVALLAARFRPGGAWALDEPDTAPAVWGRGEDVLWAQGESLMICGGQGLGKTTLAHQLIRARIGLDATLLGWPVVPTSSRVLLLAMDRPAQAARAMRRIVSEADREVLNERLTVWTGPPPVDLARDTSALTALAEAAGADTIVVDSLKDAAIGLVDDAVAAGYNRARQHALAAGVELVELHHQTKRNATGGAPDSLADVYGSTWLTSGAGSVLLLTGDAGDPVVTMRHAKQPASDVGPLELVHDHAKGRTTRAEGVDLVAMAARAPITASDAAIAITHNSAPTRAEIEKARRRLDQLATTGLLIRTDPPGRGRGATTTYIAALAEMSADALTRGSSAHE